MSTQFITLPGRVGVRNVKDGFENGCKRTFPAPPTPRSIRTVLVVGGAGYIGSVLVRGLIADGYHVRILDSFEFGEEPVRNLYGSSRFEPIRGDFRRIEPGVRATQGVDAVIHLGGIVGDPACGLNEDKTLETNLWATSLLTDVCRAAGVSRLLFASSCSVYGAADHFVDESSSPRPVSLYAATKLDSEKVLLAARDETFHPVIFRLATAFGWSYRPRFDLVVNLLTAQAVSGQKITIYNGEQWRPLIHVDDISRAFRMALAAPVEHVSGETFNVGGEVMNFTLQELAEQILEVEPDLDVEFVDNNDRRSYRVRFDKIRRSLGFHCRTSLRSGILGLRDAIRRGLVSDYREPRYSNYRTLTNGVQHAPSVSEPEMEFTALRFAKNSLWWRMISANRAQNCKQETVQTNGRVSTEAVANL